MAMTADEYKDALLRQLNGTAAEATRSMAFWTNQLQYAETEAIRDQTQDLIDTYDALAEFSRAAALVLEDVETAF